ncbi:MAG: gamma-glutamylcyclotransferase family protein [Opitutales bacterium]
MQPTYPVKVFVYGTLKRGGSNHDCLEDANATFVCNAKTKELRRLIIIGLPYLCDGHAEDGYQVEGEIYSIPDAEGLGIIDRLESNGTFYKRRVDDFVDSDAESRGEPTERQAWVYYIVDERSGEPQPRYDLDC